LGAERFMASYGDGVAALDLNDLLRFHTGHGRQATLTAVRPHSQFGILELGLNGRVRSFLEKPQMMEWVNGGFFVFEPSVLPRLDDGSLESGVLELLARDAELMAYQTNDYWACLDTYKDKIEIEELWLRGTPPWSTWDRSVSRTGTR
jgi:glucose-1-phosphate cytidylyltransferase